jgi:2-aminoethylphosphonate-pyruvate transaminase
MARALGIVYTVLSYEENKAPVLKEVEFSLAQDPQITHLAMVHCETTSGIFNPIHEVGMLCQRLHKTYIVDAMSSFGAFPIDVQASCIDYLISSANKCIEGVPGFSFIIAKKSEMHKSEGLARSLSLDLYSQWKAMEARGEFRYTPPTHSILAFERALEELEMEGGVSQRAIRYQENHRILVQGMTKMGFKTFLRPEDLGYIITSFRYLESSLFNYETFYQNLQAKGYVIYSGKVSQTPCFRIGNIGRIFGSDIKNLLAAIRETLEEMKIAVL